MSGKLYLVPTPIGNMEDITLRALKVLGAADVILAEDTRTSAHLLKHYDINKRVLAHHQHNEHLASAEIIKFLNEGQTVALISDAGTPAISDPGFYLARAAIKAGVQVECLPGATAFVPALVISGLAADSFTFEGFLPPKKGRQTKLKEIAAQPRTVIIYEGVHKLLKTLGELAEYCGADRQISVSRELTKMYEETVRGTIAEVQQHFMQGTVKGEFVICIGAAQRGNNEK